MNGILLVYIPSELFVQLSLTNDNKLPVSIYINNVQYANNQLFTITNNSYQINSTSNSSSFCFKLDLNTINNVNLSNLSYILINSNITLVFSIIAPGSK